MKRLPIILAALCSAPASADDIYHIGNSLTWDSNPPAVAAFAGQRGHSATFGHHIRCSMPLNYIWEHPTETCVVPTPGLFTPALTTYAWDAVTLQPHRNYSSTIGTDVAAIGNFIDLTRTNPANAGTRFFVMQGWTNRYDYQTEWDTASADDLNTPMSFTRDYFDHLMGRLRNAIDAEIYLIPVGEVLYLLDQRMQAGDVPGYTTIDDFYRDDLHLSLDLGRFVASVTNYAVLYGDDPRGLTKPAGYFTDTVYSSALYDAMEQAVWDVVSTHEYSTIPEPATAGLMLTGAACFLRRRRIAL
jgi:hypothetical protein